MKKVDDMFWTMTRAGLSFVVAVSLALPGCTGRAGRRGGEVPTGGSGGEAPTTEAEGGPLIAPDLSVGEDILEEARRRNSAAFASPPSQFRAGTVSAIPFEASAIEKSDEGFRVRMPSGAPITTPTVYNDLVITSGGFRSHEVFAFRAGDGDLAWAIRISDDGPSNAACDDDVCVFNTESCTLFAVQASTGEMLWSWYLGDPLMSSPSVANGLVFAAYPAFGGASRAPTEGESVDRPNPEGVTHALAAFDLRTGELRWARWIEADVISAPVAIADAVYAATFAGTIYRLNQQTGEISAARDAQATTAPTLIDRALYFAHRADSDNQQAEQTGSGMRARRQALESIVRSEKKEGGPAVESAPRPAVYLEAEMQDTTEYNFDSDALDAANGFANGAPAAANARAARRLVGRDSVYGLQEYQGSWVLGFGDANYAAMGDSLVCIDRQSGRERWDVQLPGDLRRLGGTLAPPPAAAGAHLVVATVTGEVLVMSPSDGNISQRLQVGAPVRSQPAVDRGWIYVGTTDGQLVGLNTGDTSLTGWPTWAGNPARTGAPTR